MKKVFVSLFTLAVLMVSVALANVKSDPNDLTVRFCENTLVVTSPEMTEARLFDMDARLLEIQKGQYASFELEKGTYRLLAKVGDRTLLRRIEVR